jgi:SAM-dependent methyltransferase
VISIYFRPKREGVSARDLGYVLVKHPDKIWSHGDAKLYFPTARDDLLHMVFEPPRKFVEEHVSPEPYIVNARTATGLAAALRDTLRGHSKERPDLVEEPWGIDLSLGPIWGARAYWQKLFAPLGYRMEELPENQGWNHDAFMLNATHDNLTVQQIVSHLYVLLLAMDPSWMLEQDAQVDKVLSTASRWLSGHPMRDAILRKLNPKLARSMRERIEGDVVGIDIDGSAIDEVRPRGANKPESEALSLHQERRRWMVEQVSEWVRGLPEEEPVTIFDLGCGTGWMLQDLAAALGDRVQLIGFEPDPASRDHARRYTRKIKNARIVMGAVGLDDFGMTDYARPQGRLGILCSEVLEHIDRERLGAVFHSLRSQTPDKIWLTLPNRLYNTTFGLEEGELRHPDHRWEPDPGMMSDLLEMALPNFHAKLCGITSEKAPRLQDVGAPTLGWTLTPIGPMTSCAFIAETISKPDDRDVSWHAPTGDDPNHHEQLHLSKAQYVLAFDAWSRFLVDPRKVPFIPATMAPGGTSSRDGLLEHPEDAFAYYREREVHHVVCETKHMGSRAVAVVQRQGPGFMYTRMGRKITVPGVGDILRQLDMAMEATGLWGEYDEAVIDGELLPWSSIGERLIEQEFRSVHKCGLMNIDQKIQHRGEYAMRATGFDEEAHRIAGQELPTLPLWREHWNLEAFRDALDCYDQQGPLQYAPFHILGMRGGGKGQSWLDVSHIAMVDKLHEMRDVLHTAGAASRLVKTEIIPIDLDSETSCVHAIQEWERATTAGAEGFVVKPPSLRHPVNGAQVQPMVKVRGPEYLRIIYGPDYPDRLEQLRRRRLGFKRFTALQQTLFGFEAIEAWCRYDQATMQKYTFAGLATSFRHDDPRL